MAEIVARRTYTSKTFDDGAGVSRLQAHAGHIHYKDNQGYLVDVDFRPEDAGTYWKMEKASYRLYVAKDFGAANLIRFENHYEGANHAIIFEPHSLWWIDRTNRTKRTLFANAQSVQGAPNAQERKVTWAPRLTIWMAMETWIS